MTRAHGTLPDGTAVDLIGQLLHLRPVPAPGIRFTEDTSMTKATHDGAYTLGESRFLMRAGQVLPDGAIVDPIDVPAAAPETTAKSAAPENKTKAPARETKAKTKATTDQ